MARPAGAGGAGVPDGNVETKIEPPADDAKTRRKLRQNPAPDMQEPKQDASAAADEDEDEEEEEDVLLPEARPSFDRSEISLGDAKYREDTVHVYGLDFLKTEHMNEIFNQFNHRFIEWINDSSANIVFRSKESAKKALESLSYPKAGDPPWRRTPDILVNDDCPPIFLQMRLATRTDVKKSKKAVPKVLAEDSKIKMPTRDRSRAKGFTRPYRDGMTTELLEQAGLLGKRAAQEPLTEEEAAKRQKRVARFGEVEPSRVVVKMGTGIEPLELTQEELEKRKKRAERFEATEVVSATLAVSDSSSAIKG